MDALSFLADRPIGVLATVGADGTPHAAPVEVLVHGGKVYAWVESFSVKARNVGREGRAALTAYKGGAGALVRGPARLLKESDPSYERITKAFLHKYDREEVYGNDTLVEITPERATAWEE